MRADVVGRWFIRLGWVMFVVAVMLAYTSAPAWAPFVAEGVAVLLFLVPLAWVLWSIR